MEARFVRNVPALSAQECALLRAKKAAVIGCGGLGGYLVEFLARIGIGSIVAVDGDVFEKSNLNRQLLSNLSNLGTGKAKAAAERVRLIDPKISVQAVEVFLDETNAAGLIQGCDVVLDALDNIPARKILAKACGEAGIPYIYGAIQGWIAQTAVLLPGDPWLEVLYPEGTVIRDNSVLSFTPALCAAQQAALCIRLLTGRPLETGKLFYFDLLHQEFETIPMI